jgi:hypothetical protein
MGKAVAAGARMCSRLIATEGNRMFFAKKSSMVRRDGILDIKAFVVATILGVAGAIIFVYSFPAGAITTLMHEVLKLPGPGAGIALILGPFIIFFSLLASRIAGKAGAACMTSLSFSLMVAVLVAILNLSIEDKGKFGGIEFFGAAVLCGLIIDFFLHILRGWKASLWKFIMTSCIANTGLLIFYWLLIFPQTAGWVKVSDVPILVVLCLLGGLVVAVTAIFVSKPFAAQKAGGQKGD